jgi:acetate kinase
MSRAVLAFNSGSSSVKYALYDEALRCVLHGQDEGWDLKAALAHAEGPGLEIVAAGHRIVHGGDRYAKPILLDKTALQELEKLTPLAPLHQKRNLAPIRALAARRPGLPQVACFDTAFHQTQPEIARLFPLPRALTDAGVKRYGFHGLSYEYVARKLQAIPGLKGSRKIIIAHLGNGASLCALLDGRSVASTMGFTALDGLMMGTRSGSIDPGVLLYLMEEKGMSSRDLEQLLYRESGLLGVSGLTHDMRALLASSEPRAKLAVDLFVYRIVREVGSLAAALGGLDALVFTGGIGEHAAPVREAVCRGIGWLGPVTVAVVPTNEEEMIARHTLEVTGCALPAAA